ncbi:MAG: L,D-transpeptidase [Pseudolabrys sp.]|nr:L,D-transpeptidase [Pseudolabrys sp.]
MSRFSAAVAIPAAFLAVFLAVQFGPIAPAQAGVVVTVDKTAQLLSVSVDGFQRYQWPVSTARWGYRTPNGTYRPQWLARKWASRKYDMSPMPYSIFFHGGYAIHGSYELSRLGSPASHGCIRLHPENAAVLFKLVKANMKNTRIVVTGDRPGRAPRARNSRARERAASRPSNTFETIFGPPGHQY